MVCFRAMRTPDLQSGLPGLLALLTLAGTLYGVFAAPATTLAIAALLATYSAARFVWIAMCAAVGYRMMDSWNQADWNTNAMNVSNPVQHIVLIPIYHEPEAVLVRTLDSLAVQAQAKTHMTVVLAVEAAGAAGIEATAQNLRTRYLPAFYGVYVTVHPAGLPGEIQCKGANLTWAMLQLLNRGVVTPGMYSENALVTVCDADTRWHPRYFAALTTVHNTNFNRSTSFYQGVMQYHGNIWDAHPLMRHLHAYAGAFELAYITRFYPLPMSSYSVSQPLLRKAEYWSKDVIADEWHLYLKAHIATQGEVSTKPVMLPFVADVVDERRTGPMLRARYKQTRRHALGSAEMGFYWFNVTKFDWRLQARLSHDVLLGGAGWLLLTVGSQGPILLHPALLTSPAFLLLNAALLVIVACSVVVWWLDVKARPPGNPGDRWLALVSVLVVPLSLALLVAVPTLEAQMRLLLRAPLAEWDTVRSN